MGKWFEKISEDQSAWMQQQHIFFVATAAASGRVNVSPKGHVQQCFAVLGENKVAYLDMTGSGAETFAHSKIDGRITVMFVAFAGPPKIMRLHGTCECVLKEHASFDLKAHFSDEFVAHKGFRAIMVIDVSRVSQSCGFSMPLYEYMSNRPTLYDLFENKTAEYVDDYHILKNSFSIDGFPGLGHRMHKPGNPRVAMRLTDGTGKLTPNAKGGWWFGYKDRTAAEVVQGWLCLACVFQPLSWRDLRMISLGATLAMAVMHRHKVANCVCRSKLQS